MTQGEANLRSPVSWPLYHRFSDQNNIFFFGNVLSFFDKNFPIKFFRERKKLKRKILKVKF